MLWHDKYIRYISNITVDINECESDPCENDGTCSDQLNGFTCSCVAGFTGTNCEISKSMYVYRNIINLQNI
jgi:hypothetical protein